ncbi:MAG: HPr-rel-A system PqqD family peptide chaperone [Proteobacteria bacterium]|nr:HPr-rel-A system PqqD family peptide chaperone [Pseudomonadota bacterium]
MLSESSAERLKDLAVSESGFLFDPRTGSSFTLNETGRRIFDCLKHGKAETEILQALSSEYEADTLVLERDLYDFVIQLKAMGLLHT